MAVVYGNSEGGGSDEDDILQVKLAELEKEVKALHFQKQKLEQLLLQPVELRSLASEEHMTRTANTRKHLLQLENKWLLNKLMFHRLSGVVVVKREGRDIILEFSASVRGHYYEPGLAHFRKVDGGSWVVIRYFLPVSVNLRGMVETSPLNGNRELINFVQSVQQRVEAYYDRKYQITLAKEWAQSNGVKVFCSIDCMFVTVMLKESNRRPFPLTIILIYEASGARPVSLETQSKGIDKRKLAKIATEYDVLMDLSLAEGLPLIFKQTEGSESTSSETGSSSDLIS